MVLRRSPEILQISQQTKDFYLPVVRIHTETFIVVSQVERTSDCFVEENIKFVIKLEVVD